MTQQDNKVVNINQELITKNTDMFSDITTVLETLFNQGLASFSFDYQETVINLDSVPEVEEVFAHYDPDRVQDTIEEVVDITLMLLDNREEQLLSDAAKEGHTVQAIMEQKIKIIKEKIINPKLQQAYYFYRTCISNVMEQFVAQRVVKPPSGQFPALSSFLVKLTVKDNLDHANRQNVSFELYEDQLDELITLLSQLKQELKQEQPQK
ncbi:hypothetical protein [Desulforamulus ruminis]|uniref:Uncharacterized protein n=1 Tax=Desulforamulus ruminis (strain ATCC 23193 / DSM 2154 / NCIMB 8452 / DL) TaxID=696281 RepID=F6DKP7_DESRL|nr:hypothetical protein [Desulforamulus ruminis]AEG60422.1 hypothetical protein Desru_2172 [Desulforamulus ruminis DSM 2154]